MRGTRSKKMWLGGALALANTGIQLFQQHQQKKQQDADMAAQKLAQERESQLGMAQQQIANLPPPVAYTPTFSRGGNISTMDNNKYVDYSKGQSHGGPDGGIPVDAQGQPTIMSGGAEVALTEKGEVTFNGYVYSDEIKIPGNKKITFADEAKRIKKKHEFYLGKKLDKKEPISRNALESELERLMMLQETIKGNTITQEEADMQTQMAMEQMAMPQQESVGMEQGMPDEMAGMEPPMQQEGLPMMQAGGTIPVRRRIPGILPLYYTTEHQINPYTPNIIDNQKALYPQTQVEPEITKEVTPAQAVPVASDPVRTTTTTTPATPTSNSYRGYAFPEGANSVDAVKAMQQRLQDAGAYQGNIDGMWGPQSMAAQEEFTQRLGDAQTSAANMGKATRLSPINLSKPLQTNTPSSKEILESNIQQQQEARQSEDPLFQGGVPWQSMIPGAAASALQMGVGLAMNRRRPVEDLRLGRMGYNDISLAPERARALSEGRIARSTMNRNISRRGDLSSAGVLAAQQGVSADINRGVGQQVGQLSVQEAMANQQGRLAVDQANLQARAQEQMYGVQARAAERHRHADTKAAIVSSGISNLAGTAQGWQDQDRHSRQFAQWLAMAQPDYKLMSQGKGRNQRFKSVRRTHSE